MNSQLGQYVSCYPGSGLSGDETSVHPYQWQSEQTGTITQMCSMLGQRRIQLTGIETVGCDAGPTLMNRYWVGRPTLCVPGTSVDVTVRPVVRRTTWMLASTGDGGGRSRPTR